MFTRATRNFGIWRERHTSQRRYAGAPTWNFVLALAAAAFVSALCFFITWKVRGEFFLIESAHIELSSSRATGGWLFEGRSAALTLALLPAEKAGVEIVFERGESFRLPDDREELLRYVRGRMEGIEFQAMLTMSVEQSSSRVQIWPHKGTSVAAVREVLDLLGREGFDDFDVAVAAPKRGRSL